MRYASVAEHRLLIPVRAICRCLRIHPTCFYTWLRYPLRKQALEDARQTERIRPLEGSAYLGVVIDLYFRRVVGWSMQGRQTTDLVLRALLMAVWRRKPKNQVLFHSFPVHQFGLGIVPEAQQSGTLDVPARELS